MKKIPLCENIKIKGLPNIYVFNEKCTDNKDDCRFRPLRFLLLYLW